MAPWIYFTVRSFLLSEYTESAMVQTRFRTQLSYIMCWSAGEQRRGWKVKEGTRWWRWWGLASFGAQKDLLRRVRGFKRSCTEDCTLMLHPLSPGPRACVSNAGLLQERWGEAELGMWASWQLAEALERGTVTNSISLHWAPGFLFLVVRDEMLLKGGWGGDG